MSSPTRLFSVIGAAILLASCGSDRIAGPSLVESNADPRALAAVTCSAHISAGSLICGEDGATGADATGIDSKILRPVILGGQNQFVTLASSNVEVYADTFAFDVTVQNLIGQALGTIDGVTPSPNGIQVFFASGPISTESGDIIVANPDGIGTFTATNQPYFDYPGLLATGATSDPKRWMLQFDPEVDTFIFTVYVYAEVAYPDGYVDDLPYVLTLDPGEEWLLDGVVRTVTGRPLSDEIAWSSEDPAIASISGFTVTAGDVQGFTTLSAFAGGRPGIYTTAVSVCPSVAVADGSIHSGSIDSSDCFSSFGGEEDRRPTSSHYGDLYRVALRAGETVTLTVEPEPDLDTVLTLAAPRTGIVVAWNDDDDLGEFGLGSRIVYTAKETGTYVIEVSAFNAEETGSYVLGVSIGGDI